MVKGDKIKISEFYLSHYPKWKIGAGTGVITEVMESKVPADRIDSAGRAMFLARYGNRPEYPFVSMFIKLDSGPETYLVSEFGIDKVEV